MSAHLWEDELFFLGEVFLKLRFESCIEVMKTREHFAMMRIMDDENFIEKFFGLCHETAVRDVMRGLQIVEHIRDAEFLKGFNVCVDVPLLCLSCGCLIEIAEELFYVHSLLLNGDRDRLVAAAAVIEMKPVEKADCIRMRFHDIRQSHILCNHCIASFAFRLCRRFAGNTFSISDENKGFCCIWYGGDAAQNQRGGVCGRCAFFPLTFFARHIK